MAILLELMGRKITRLWLGDSAFFDPLIFSMLLLLTVFSALWNASAVVLTATNSHLKLAAIYVGGNSVALFLGAWMASVFGWWALLTCLASVEIFMLSWVMPKVLSLTADRFSAFVKGASVGGFRGLISRPPKSG
jgi:hypothetical protein